MASCWVSVEPPCETPRLHHVGDRGAGDADRIDAVMRIEAAVLDGDERLRQIGRQILQRDIGAGHFAARGQHAAVEAHDLDGRRALWNFQRLDRRQMGADPDHDADDGDRGPQAEHRAPVDQPAEPESFADFERRLAPPRPARGLRSRGASSSSSSSGLRLGTGFFGLSSSLAAGMRSSGESRRSASVAGSPNSGSLRPPLFFRPHAMTNAAHTRPALRYRAQFKARLPRG